MKTFKFKTQEDFLAWNEEQGNFVTAIYDNREFVCDVLQKDYLYLRDIGFVDECAEIIPPLTIGQREMFKHSWGVEVVIIYDEIARLLTWYEHRGECPYDDDELYALMYDTLTDVQNEMSNS